MDSSSDTVLTGFFLGRAYLTEVDKRRESRSRTRHARQPAITSLVESELDPPVPPHLSFCLKLKSHHFALNR